jgi:hypothetical protein
VTETTQRVGCIVKQVLGGRYFDRPIFPHPSTGV